MQGAQNPAGVEWHITRQALDRETGEWAISWALNPECPGTTRPCACRPTRVVKARMGAAASGIVVERGEQRVYLNLPATLIAELDLSEGYRYKNDPGGGVVVRPKVVTVVVGVDESGPEPRAVVESVTVSRADSNQVTAASLRVPLGDLVDWMLARAPVAELEGGSPPRGVLAEQAAAEARRVAGRRSGKRSDRVLTVDEVVTICRDVPANAATSAVLAARPWEKRRTVQRVLAEARALGRLPHSGRSRAAAERAAHRADIARDTGKQG